MLFTPDQARERILQRIGAGHREPFAWLGTTYHVRIPTRLELECANKILEQHGRTVWLASLATTCAEVGGRPLFRATDASVLIHDEPQGFLEAFRAALMPFLLEVPEVASRPARAPVKAVR